MSKAKQRALEAYPIKIAQREGYDENLRERKGFVKGYQQAEKDFELTWEDIPEIFRISEQLKTSWWSGDNEQSKKVGTQVFWEEVLKRFKEKKELQSKKQ